MHFPIGKLTIHTNILETKPGVLWHSGAYIHCWLVSTSPVLSSAEEKCHDAYTQVTEHYGAAEMPTQGQDASDGSLYKDWLYFSQYTPPNILVPSHPTHLTII